MFLLEVPHYQDNVLGVMDVLFIFYLLECQRTTTYAKGLLQVHEVQSK